MVKAIVKDPLFLAQKSEPATMEDQQVITKKKGPFQTEEGCLSLEGVRACTRYKEIEVDYLDQNFNRQHGKFAGWTAQIIQHELDHVAGIVI